MANTLNTPRKFLFDTSFEPADAAEAKRRNKPMPKYFDADLARAREEGFAAGKDEGARVAMERIEQTIAQALGVIGQQLPHVAQKQIEIEERQTRNAIDVAGTLVRKLFPKMVRRQGLSEIESLVGDALERLREEPRIVIRVAEELLDPIKERIGALAQGAGFEGRVIFLAQDGMAPGDARVEWADGGAERDTDRLWREIDTIIERLVNTPRDQPSPDNQTNAERQNAAAGA